MSRAAPARAATAPWRQPAGPRRAFRPQRQIHRRDWTGGEIDLGWQPLSRRRSTGGATVSVDHRRAIPA